MVRSHAGSDDCTICLWDTVPAATLLRTITGMAGTSTGARPAAVAAKATFTSYPLKVWWTLPFDQPFQLQLCYAIKPTNPRFASSVYAQSGAHSCLDALASIHGTVFYLCICRCYVAMSAV